MNNSVCISIYKYPQNNIKTINYNLPALDNISLRLNEPWKIYQQNEYIIKSKKDLDYGEKLLEIEYNDKKGYYEIIFNQNDINTNNNLNNINNTTWFTLIQNKIENIYNRYELKEGNIIKLGNVFLKLKKLNINNKNNINLINNQTFQQIYNCKFAENSDSTNIINACKKEKGKEKELEINLTEVEEYKSKLDKKIKKLILSKNINCKHLNLKETNNNKICRICYTEETDKVNPLIHPCSCQGSMKYVHYKCLKYWLEKNSFIIQEKSDFYIKYIYKEPKCELCKTKFPEVIYHKGKEYNFFDTNNLFNEFTKYSIFELLSNDDNKYKILYVLSLDRKVIKIGRSNDNELIILESSISRNHCLLKIINNNLFIEDANSKFGTLILVQTPSIKLVDKLNLYLQVGNNFIKCKVNNSSKNTLFSCCYVENEKKNYDFYYKQNIIKSKETNYLDIKSKISNSESEDENEGENKTKLEKIRKTNKLIIKRPKNNNMNNSATKEENITPLNGIKIIPENKK